MLAYTLGLQHAQLSPPYPRDAPLVVVDDCALTGNRFGRFMKHCESSQLIFAPLYSHRDVRAAIEIQEPRVVACISARELHDHAPARRGRDYADWQERWAARSEPPCYWLGEPEHVCFAWSEPDIGIWNPVTGCEEPGWRLAPPEFCLKNRLAAGTASAGIQVQPAGKGPLKPSPDVVFGDLKGEIVLADIRTGRCYQLADMAAAMWRAIIEFGDLEEIEAVLLQQYAVDEPVLRADLSDFAERLLTSGLLQHGDGAVLAHSTGVIGSSAG
jgi:hypothetical protein